MLLLVGIPLYSFLKTRRERRGEAIEPVELSETVNTPRHQSTQAEAGHTMITVVLLLIVWVPYFLVGSFRTHDVRTLNEYQPRSVAAMPEAFGNTGDEPRSAWTALDDRQLTRLLIDSAPRTITE